MNFFILGYALVTFQLGLNSIWCYAAKLLGMLFIMGAVVEIRAQSKDFGALMKPAQQSAAVALVCSLVQVVVKLVKVKGIALDIICILTGAVATLAVFAFLYRFIQVLCKNMELVNDKSNIARFYSGWKKLAVLTGVNLLFDIILRFCGDNMLGAVVGIIVFYSKIIIYIFVIITLFSFNKARNDFNKKNSSSFMHSDD